MQDSFFHINAAISIDPNYCDAIYSLGLFYLKSYRYA